MLGFVMSGEITKMIAMPARDASGKTLTIFPALADREMIVEMMIVGTGVVMMTDAVGETNDRHDSIR